MSTTGPSGAIVELEGGDATPAGQDRRRAVALAFALSLAVGSASVGPDRPAALAPRAPEPQAAMHAPSGEWVVFSSPASGRWQPAVWGPTRAVTGSIGPAGANGRVVLVYVGTPPSGVRFLPPDGFVIVNEGTDVVNVEGIAD
jgi:hypothetical protein